MKFPTQYQQEHPLQNRIQWQINWFVIPSPFETDHVFNCLATAGDEWEHVAVTIQHIGHRPERCATWLEMCFIKDLFWDDEQTAMQLHPPKSEWISNHKFALHLWRSVKQAIPLPPSEMVGLKKYNGKF